jgi:hypothetical protein
VSAWFASMGVNGILIGKFTNTAQSEMVG